MRTFALQVEETSQGLLAIKVWTLEGEPLVAGEKLILVERNVCENAIKLSRHLDEIREVVNKKVVDE